MKLHYSISAIALLLFSLIGCSKVDLEEEASQGIWFNKTRSEVLYLDKDNSAFVRQPVGWYTSESGLTVVYRNGSDVSFPYRIENDRFIFEGDTYILSPTAMGWSSVIRYEEAYFDQVGNLIVQFGRLLPNADGYQKDPRPESTWESIYVLKDSSLFGN